MENQHIFHIFHFSFRRRSARRNRKKIVEFIFGTSEEGTLFDIDRKNLVFLSLNDDGEQRSERHRTCFGA